MSTLKNIGMKLAGGIIAAGLAGGAAFAFTGSVISVNLPQAVAVGNAVLPSGDYKITMLSMNDGNKLFVFRSDKGEATSAVAMSSADAVADQKTEVLLSSSGGTMHLDKMFIAGETTGYQFAASK